LDVLPSAGDHHKVAVEMIVSREQLKALSPEDIDDLERYAAVNRGQAWAERLNQPQMTFRGGL
jgi:hypothetical protein